MHFRTTTLTPPYFTLHVRGVKKFWSIIILEEYEILQSLFSVKQFNRSHFDRIFHGSWKSSNDSSVKDVVYNRSRLLCGNRTNDNQSPSGLHGSEGYAIAAT
jgi:hypothetical protein